MNTLGILVFVLFGVVAVIFLVECLEQLFAAGRRWLARGPKSAAPTFATGFSLRRPDSALRERHHRRNLANGRLTEINRPKDDPCEP